MKTVLKMLSKDGKERKKNIVKSPSAKRFSFAEEHKAAKSKEVKKVHLIACINSFKNSVKFMNEDRERFSSALEN